MNSEQGTKRVSFSLIHRIRFFSVICTRVRTISVELSLSVPRYWKRTKISDLGERRPSHKNLKLGPKETATSRPDALNTACAREIDNAYFRNTQFEQ